MRRIFVRAQWDGFARSFFRRRVRRVHTSPTLRPPTYFPDCTTRCSSDFHATVCDGEIASGATTRLTPFSAVAPPIAGFNLAKELRVVVAFDVLAIMTATLFCCTSERVRARKA